jgi:hypothetical protein
MTTLSKNGFLEAYQRRLVCVYDWARADPHRLAKFMRGVACTIEHPNALEGSRGWDHHGDVSVAVWRELGGKGRPTLKALRALPVDPEQKG